MLFIRFWKLDVSPPGFDLDEMVAAGSVSCFAQTGESVFGVPHPFFFDARVGSPVSPVFVYMGAAWTRVFGGGIASFRGFAALFGVLACFGAAIAAYFFRGYRAAAWTLAVAALSPWSFHFSRIAWDASLAPAFVIFGFVCAIQRGFLWKIAGGFLLALSAYAYPPLRVHAPLIIVGLLVLLVKRKDPRGALALVTSAALASLPLVWVLLSGNLMVRFGEIGVFSDQYRALTGGHWYNYPLVFFENYLKHFSPRFLFISGDSNWRHSTQKFGELGWLDILALGCGIVLAAKSWARRFRGRSEKGVPSEGIGIVAWCAATGFVPAALTWESLPHALRSISVWPFWAIAAGCLLAAFVERYTWSAPAIVVVALAFSVTFSVAYFRGYPKLSHLHFYVPLKEAAEQAKRSADWQGYFETLATYPQGVNFYYPVQYGGMSCADVRAILAGGK